MKKEQIEIFAQCCNCGYKPKPNKKDSNKNWDVYDTICPKCGERIELEGKGE